MTAIDWTELAERLGTLRPDGESGSDHYARLALCEIIGTGLADAVEHYVDGRRGSELVRSVLWLLQPVAAMERCYSIFRTDPEVERRRAAVELLKVVGDGRVVGWIAELLRDPDRDIQNWGACALDQLVYRKQVEPLDIEPLLRLGEVHENEYVREKMAFIRTVIANQATA
jgi:HEAT repeat protein